MQTTSFWDVLISPLWLLAGALLALGVVLLIIGWRGRRIDDHPICRRCGFDLFGKPADSDTCSECGTDVSRPKTIRIGRRKRGRALIAVGLVLMFVGIGGGGLGGYATAQQIDWTPWLPLSWIAADLDATGYGTYNPAVNEIKRRLQANSLSVNQIDWLVTTALAKQGDRTTPWPRGWRETLDDFLARGLLDEPRIKTYLTQAAAPVLEIKPTLRRGRSANFHFDGTWDRLTPATRLNGTQRSTPMTLGGAVIVKSPFESETQDSAYGFGSYGLGTHLYEKDVADIPDGPHTLTITMRYELTLNEPVQAGPFTIEYPLSLPVTLAAKDAVVDTFEADPSLRPAVHAAVLDARVEEDEKGRVAVSIRTDPPPMSLAMSVHLRQDEQEQHIGTLRIRTADNAQWHRVWTGKKPIFTDGQVDVVLRPSQDAADNTRSLDTYWGEQIVLEDIGVNAPREAVFNDDMNLRPAVEACLKIERLVVAKEGKRRLQFFVACHEPPVKLTFRVIARSGAKQSTNNSMPNFQPMQNMSYGITMPLPDPDATTVDIILQPDPQWEINTSDLTPPWGGQVVFKNIPLPTTPGERIGTRDHPIRPSPLAEPNNSNPSSRQSPHHAR